MFFINQIYCTLTSLISSIAYAWVGTSPALSASTSGISPVAMVMRQWPWWNLSCMRLNSLSLLKSSELLRIATRSGIQPVRAFRSMFWKKKIWYEFKNHFSIAKRWCQCTNTCSWTNLIYTVVWKTSKKRSVLFLNL